MVLTPGAPEYVYCPAPLPRPLAVCLRASVAHVTHQYTHTVKGVVHRLRQERERVLKYLYYSRADFTHFLQRPDHKQEFVSEWQARILPFPINLPPPPLPLSISLPLLPHSLPPPPRTHTHTTTRINPSTVLLPTSIL